MNNNNVVWKSSGHTEWRTPDWLFDILHSEFHFTIDVAATHENHKLFRFFTKEHGGSGLDQNWDGECVFVNPPYARGQKTGIYAWVEKAAQIRQGVTVAILPVRTGTMWWQRFVLNHSEIRYLPGRIKFVKPDGTLAEAGAGFDTAIVIWDHTHWRL